jgi:hypothetical protein
MPLPHPHREWCNRAVAVSGHLSARVVLMQESRAAISDCASLPSGFQWLRLNPIGPISLYSSIFVIFMPWHVTAGRNLPVFAPPCFNFSTGPVKIFGWAETPRRFQPSWKNSQISDNLPSSSTRFSCNVSIGVGGSHTNLHSCW